MQRSVVVLLFAGTALAAVGQVLFKLGATGRVSAASFVNPAILAGLACYGLGTLAWIYSLSKAPLTNVYPFTALTFVIVYLAGVFFLGEPSSLRGWSGIALVLAGLYLMTAS